MSNQMSTSINNLPPVDKATAPPINSDPIVSDVLAEMEREVAAAQKPSVNQSQHQTSFPQPTQVQYGNQQMPMLLPPYMKEPSNPWVDTSKLQTAVVASIIAVVLLIPNVSFIYEKFEKLASIRSYELFIRIALLALVLYVAMIKLNL